MRTDDREHWLSFFAAAVLPLSMLAFVGGIALLVAAVAWFAMSWPVWAGIAGAWLPSG